ncbi:MAG: restriction endonuclease subunit S [Chitinophagales bacterium]|nr:restriction endonuclease subunit S [Chitinophagales bacterium]
MNRIPLSQVCNYSDASVPISELDLNNFISTDNMLPNRGGIVEAVNLPPANTCSAFTKNEILISNIRPYFKKIWFAEFDGGCSADVLVLKTTNPKFDAKFVYYNLFQDLFFKHQMTGSKGSKMPRGDKDQIMTFLIPEFDKSYQQRIADFLTVIDDKIALNKRINSELETLAKTIYNYWFVQFDFPDEEGKPYKTSGGEMEWNKELKREIPKGWRQGTFNDIAEIVGGSTPSTADKRNFTKNGTAWITPKDLAQNIGNKFITKGENDVSELGIKSASLTIMPKNTILMSSRAPIGYLAISRRDVTTNQGFKSFIPKQNYSTSFIYYLVQSYIPTFIKHGSGSTFKEISKSLIEEIKIYIPKMNVINDFTEKMNPIFRKQDFLEIENQELIKLRDFLLPMLMNGQVKVKSEAKEQLSMAAEPQVKYGK